MLRALRPLDLSQLRMIEAAIQIDPWSLETFERCFKIDSCGWVIEHTAGKVIGFIIVLIQAGECHILNMGVDPSQQCQGYGSKLLAHALAEAKKQGAAIAYLEVRRSNANAIALYRKMGFEKIGERNNYYSAAAGREDALVFSKSISTPL